MTWYDYFIGKIAYDAFCFLLGVGFLAIVFGVLFAREYLRNYTRK